MFLKPRTFLRKQGRKQSKSLQPQRIKPNQGQANHYPFLQSKGKSKLSDFLMIDGLNNRRSHSQQKSTQNLFQPEHKEVRRSEHNNKRPSVCRQLKLPVKNNKLIINFNSNNKGQEKIEGNQTTEASDSNHQLTPFETKNDNDFNNFQMFQSNYLKDIPKLKNKNSLTDKEIISIDPHQKSKERRAAKKQTIKASLQKHTKRQRLIIRRKQVEYSYCTSQTEVISQRMEKTMLQIQQLEKKQMYLEINLKSFQKVYREIEIQHKIKTEELGQYQARLNHVLAQFESKSKRLVQMQAQIEKNTEIMNNIEQKGMEVMNYVNTQQRRKILHEVSQDYKKKEGDMYDYALQMQTNTWATSFKELKPFTEQEKYLQQRINSLCRELSNDRNPASFDKKCNEIREFVFKMYSSFKRMNDDMRSINDFKTKCIRQFVARMQSWLQNWQLKQQFLVNLRQEFAVEEMKLNQILQSFQSSMVFSGMSSVELQKLKQIGLGINKITENYKLGNSFY